MIEVVTAVPVNLMLQRTQEREFAFDDADFRFLARLANEKSGIVMSENKRDMIYARLARRLRALNLNSFSEYCELLQTAEGASEIANLINAVTTNLTSFFRENHHFEHLRDVVLPGVVAVGRKHLRIWSAACSAGMEPYSIAMTAKDAIPDIQNWNARILATDIDSNILNTAMAGEYTVSEFDKIPPAYRRHVRALDNGKRLLVNENVRELVTFRQLNLLEGWPMKGKFDAVFCRNVVIYFDKETKQRLFSRIADMLKPNGWLYIGHSENLHNISDRFALTGRTIYRKVG